MWLVVQSPGCLEIASKTSLLEDTPGSACNLFLTGAKVAREVSNIAPKEMGS